MKRIVKALSKLNRERRAYAVFVLCATSVIALHAQTLTTLHSFCQITPGCADGNVPVGGLVQATDGNLYGTTTTGGANGYGTVFKISPRGTLTTIYNFCSVLPGCTDGEKPYASLVQATDGNLYGTTYSGGANGFGTVFKITPGGSLKTLHSFCSVVPGCTDGENPNGALIQGANGELYGTTQLGGANGFGTVFKITLGGLLNTVYSFCSVASCSDGEYPFAGLIQASDGNFYGTTYKGGANGFGTVFKLTPTGALGTLYSFCSVAPGCTDGEYPWAGLVEGSDGNFYGTTSYGGTNSFGTVFKLTPTGAQTTLYSFCSVQPGCTDGWYPVAGLTLATDGNFYGTTVYGGANGFGAAFRLTVSGSIGLLATLSSFCSVKPGCTDGEYPYAGLIQDTNGKFYGTTEGGGANGDFGTVFSLSAGLGPFVETLPVSGKVGAAVKILGSNLNGATSVTFNGTPAAFTVLRPSEITTTVPTGATTGKVQVTTPSGILSSNVVFRVRP